MLLSVSSSRFVSEFSISLHLLMISLPYNIVTNLLLEVMKPGKDCSLHLLIISPPYNTLNILSNLLLGVMKPKEDCHQVNFVNPSDAFFSICMGGVGWGHLRPLSSGAPVQLPQSCHRSLVSCY